LNKDGRRDNYDNADNSLNKTGQGNYGADRDSTSYGAGGDNYQSSGGNYGSSGNNDYDNQDNDGSGKPSLKEKIVNKAQNMMHK